MVSPPIVYLLAIYIYTLQLILHLQMDDQMNRLLTCDLESGVVKQSCTVRYSNRHSTDSTEVINNEYFSLNS